MSRTTKPLDTEYEPIYDPKTGNYSGEDQGNPEYVPKYAYSTKTVEDYKPSNYTSKADEVSPLNKVAELEEQGRPVYQGKYDEQISQLLNDIYNKKDFNYDFNVDPLYQQYADQYSKNAREAMMNSMGQAAGLTGGYANSYASQVGQQQYNEQMNQLQNVIPSLYSMAKDVYDTNNSLLNNKLATFNNQDSLDYSKFRDTMGDYDTDLAYFYQKYLDAQKQNNYLTELYQNYHQLDPNYATKKVTTRTQIGTDWDEHTNDLAGIAATLVNSGFTTSDAGFTKALESEAARKGVTLQSKNGDHNLIKDFVDEANKNKK